MSRQTIAQRKLSKLPQHVEILWGLVRVNGFVTEMCYHFASTRQQLWDAVLKEEFLGTGWTKERLEAEGWVARKFKVEEIL